MPLNVWIDTLAKEWELPRPLPQQAAGVYSIPLEEGLSLSLSSLIGEGTVYLSSEVASTPKGQEGAFYQEALLANLFWQGTGGATLGLSETGNLVILSMQIDGALPYGEFRSILEDFLNYLDFWHEEVAKYA